MRTCTSVDLDSAFVRTVRKWFCVTCCYQLSRDVSCLLRCLDFLRALLGLVRLPLNVDPPAAWVIVSAFKK
jgi:hypothetical protein